MVHKLEVVAQVCMKEGRLGNILDVKKDLVILSESFQFGDMLHVNRRTKKMKCKIGNTFTRPKKQLCVIVKVYLFSTFWLIKLLLDCF